MVTQDVSATFRTELSHVKDTFKMLNIDDLRHSSTSLLFLSLVRCSSANQGVAIFWQLIEMSGLSGEVIQSCIGQCTGRCLQYGIMGCPHFKGRLIQVE